MKLRNFPPADQCDAADIDNLADLVVRDPRASYDLAGSRAHIEALCRRYQVLAQDLAATTNERDAARRERDAETKRAAALVQTMEAVDQQIDAARIEIRALASTLDHERNERQGEVLELEAERERADAGEAAAEVFETTARAALAILARDRGAQPVAPVSLAELVRAVDGRLGRALVRVTEQNAMLSQRLENALRRLDEQQQTVAANDRIRSAFANAVPAITGVTVEDLNHRLDAELAAHPEPGPLHHARDQRDHQEDTTS